MDESDRQAIDGLFGRLGGASRTGPPRDPEAEGYIAARMQRVPGAAYLMAQTLVVQEAALSRAEDRIAELEARLAERRGGGGLLAGIFGEDEPRAHRAPRDPGMPQPGLRPGPGFLGGAAQTAMGVAGGVLIANSIAGMMTGAEAGPLDAAEGAEDAGVWDDFDL